MCSPILDTDNCNEVFIFITALKTTKRQASPTYDLIISQPIRLVKMFLKKMTWRTQKIKPFFTKFCDYNIRYVEIKVHDENKTPYFAFIHSQTQVKIRRLKM